MTKEQCKTCKYLKVVPNHHMGMVIVAHCKNPKVSNRYKAKTKPTLNESWTDKKECKHWRSTE